MKRILLFNILLFAFVGVGYAQTITVSPDVICVGENSYIGTDTNLNYVHIGDIICVGNVNHDTIIVRPEAWSMYSGSYTALSVVFYVDQTGKHGWAVKAAIYIQCKWINPPRKRSAVDLDCISNKQANRSGLGDFRGYHNTECIKSDPTTSASGGYSATTYPAVGSLSNPFYLPAIGQLNYLYAQQSTVNQTLQIWSLSIPTAIWWSSTESYSGTDYAKYALALAVSGGVTTETKASSYYVLPTMNF